MTRARLAADDFPPPVILRESRQSRDDRRIRRAGKGAGGPPLPSAQGGFALPLTAIVVVVATLTVLPLLAFVSSAFIADKTTRDRDIEVMTNGAAIRQVMADLARGADALPTTYSCPQPHQPNQSFNSFTFNTTYVPPVVALNGVTPVVTIAAPQAAPGETQQYVDPGIAADPSLASVPADRGYLIRLFQVHQGTLQINWTYAPAGVGRVAVWAGCPVDNTTGLPYEPGLVSRFPTDPPVIDTGNSSGTSTSVQTAGVTVGPGIYTIVFDNTRGNNAKSTAPFALGGNNNTWIYVNASRDYVVAATVGGRVTKAYLRQVPGYAQPPTGPWSTTNPGFVPHNVYIYTWREELDDAAP